MYYSTDYLSPLGEMIISSDGEAICGLWFYGQKHFPSLDDFTQNDDLPVFSDVKNGLMIISMD